MFEKSSTSLLKVGVGVCNEIYDDRSGLSQADPCNVLKTNVLLLGIEIDVFLYKVSETVIHSHHAGTRSGLLSVVQCLRKTASHS